MITGAPTLQTDNLTAVEILMVDDDELDYELFTRQLKKQRIANKSHRAKNGEEALRFLGEWYAAPNQPPLIVLLDINMPKMGGLECLKAIRADSKLRSTIVFMLTSSNHDRDVIDAYELNVAGYMVKGDLGPAFVEGVNFLQCYWRIVELPTSA